jgi:3-hydroxyisobutyrate dehydrogenase-like beta-hydroxyacid dehydrogenase
MAKAALAIGVLGLGEVGSEIAQDLVAAGAQVRGYDPRVVAPDGVVDCQDERSAVEGRELVLSVNSSHDALDTFEAGIGGTGPSTLWAVLNTTPARLKEELQARCAARNRSFADVAMMAPVPGRGVHADARVR